MSSRSAKIATLAELLAAVEPDEVPVVAAFLSGIPRQRRVGIGYATVYGGETGPPPEPTLTVADLDTAISEIQGATGSGSAGRRRRVLGDLLARATAEEI